MDEERRRVVVTGIGAVTPLGTGADALFERWAAGHCGIADGMGKCDDFDPGAVLTRKEIRRSDRFTQLAVVAADEAVAHAGWDGDAPYQPERVGCVVGTGIGTIGTLESELAASMEQGSNGGGRCGLGRTLPNAAPARIALRHGLKGPGSTVVSACAAGAHAIGTALRLIQNGEADACVT